MDRQRSVGIDDMDVAGDDTVSDCETVLELAFVSVVELFDSSAAAIKTVPIPGPSSLLFVLLRYPESFDAVDAPAPLSCA